MIARASSAADLKARLDVLLASHDPGARRAADPVRYAHRYESAGDREVVGLVGATLAFGNVTAIGASVERVLAELGRSPAATVDRLGERALARRLSGFVHRVYRGPDVARMLARAGRLRRREGSLGEAFAGVLEDGGGELRPALARFAEDLRGPDPNPGLAHLVSDPGAGSACKRLLLYLRWMVRPADGVDLGLWPVDPARLLVPLDTHVHRITRNLGLTDRKTASWRTAEEVTAVFRHFDPADPVKYDFALCHLGVSRECPSRREHARCAHCVLQSVCIQWTGGEPFSAKRGRAPSRAP